jgi:hypothetical protein
VYAFPNLHHPELLRLLHDLEQAQDGLIPAATEIVNHYDGLR